MLTVRHGSTGVVVANLIGVLPVLAGAALLAWTFIVRQGPPRLAIRWWRPK